MIKRFFFLLLIPVLLSACTKLNSVEEITFSSWGSITEVQILEKVILNFEKENPKIKVNFIHIPQNYFQKIHLLFASSTEPDVIFINNLYLPLYAEKLENLDDIVNPVDFYSQSIEALSNNDNLMAVPRDISTLVLYYNKSIVSEDAFTDWNIDKFSSEIRKITDDKHYGISFERDIYWAQPYIMTLGYEEGIDFYKNLEGKYAPTPDQIGSYTLAQMFLEGKLGFYMSGRWMYPKILEKATFPFGIVVFPGIVPADASGWAISKKSKHKEAAKLFIKYLSSKKNIEYMTKSGLIVPARVDVSNLLDNQNERVFLESIAKSKSIKIDKTYSKDRDYINKKLFY